MEQYSGSGGPTIYRGGEGGCNVKTVKKQTFHKCTTNVPISSRNVTRTFEFVPEFVSFLFGPGEQILDQIETMFWFRFRNDIGTFVLSF